jgi:hypothetical protein
LCQTHEPKSKAQPSKAPALTIANPVLSSPVHHQPEAEKCCLDVTHNVGLPLGYEPTWILRIADENHFIDVVAHFQTFLFVVSPQGAPEEGIVAAHFRVQLVIVCPLEEVLYRLHQHPLVSEHRTGYVESTFRSSSFGIGSKPVSLWGPSHAVPPGMSPTCLECRGKDTVSMSSAASFSSVLSRQKQSRS